MILSYVNSEQRKRPSQNERSQRGDEEGVQGYHDPLHAERLDKTHEQPRKQCHDEKVGNGKLRHVREFVSVQNHSPAG